MTAAPCDPPSGAQPNAERVRIEVASDESALRIQATLEALGYDVIRDRSNYRGDLYKEVARAASQRYRLSVRERDVLIGLLRGSTNEQIAQQVRVTPATVKWHMHNLYGKIGASSREEVLRRVMRLDDLCWLRAPRLQRDALEQFNIAAHAVREHLLGMSKRAVEKPLRLLDDAITQARRLAALPSPPITD